ncbi:MAG: sugar phosphate isomerase/epimerase [Chloroflexi bacterium]|nr:MAG: sugar phosphate isomerase/epimerase [Chloroflexota bacterium]MBL1196472.1 sugar phosphate isomerase/epimerase [Chloroflexota bacterium]NOH13767.1 sugar phosphate isomerase/epimerase [Chloroflexota bacterium]
MTKMKVGIDSYCFHRFFGEVYPHQTAPDKSMTMEDFLDYAKELEVDGVSLESCFFPSFEEAWFKDLGAKLDDYGFDRVYAWGHPDGLEAGKNRDEFDSMVAQIPNAKLIGADVMRVVASSLMFRFEPHGPQLDILVEWFKEAVKVAEEYDVKLAVENHIDYTSDECVELLERVDSPYLGLNLDTGNFLRLLDDPVEGTRKLADKVYATHIKDLKPVAGLNATEWYFFSSTPVGDGLVNNQEIAQILYDADYKGFLAVETDSLHPDYENQEHEAIATSVKNLKDIASKVK